MRRVHPRRMRRQGLPNLAMQLKPMQRLLKTRMASDLLSRIHFWGWQAIIVAAAIYAALTGVRRSGWLPPRVCWSRPPSW